MVLCHHFVIFEYSYQNLFPFIHSLVGIFAMVSFDSDSMPCNGKYCFQSEQLLVIQSLSLL